MNFRQQVMTIAFGYGKQLHQAMFGDQLSVGVEAAEEATEQSEQRDVDMDS
jgi:hypothetical protein